MQELVETCDYRMEMSVIVVVCLIEMLVVLVGDCNATIYVIWFVIVSRHGHSWFDRIEIVDSYHHVIVLTHARCLVYCLEYPISSVEGSVLGFHMGLSEEESPLAKCTATYLTCLHCVSAWWWWWWQRVCRQTWIGCRGQVGVDVRASWVALNSVRLPIWAATPTEIDGKSESGVSDKVDMD